MQLEHESLVEASKRGLITLKGRTLHDRLEECCRIEAIRINIGRYKCVARFGTGDPFIYIGLALFSGGPGGSSGSHSPLAVLALDVVSASSMEIRAPDVRMEGYTPSQGLGQVRVFLLKPWTWDKVRFTLPEGYSRFNVELIQ